MPANGRWDLIRRLKGLTSMAKLAKGNGTEVGWTSTTRLYAGLLRYKIENTEQELIKCVQNNGVCEEYLKPMNNTRAIHSRGTRWRSWLNH